VAAERAAILSQIADGIILADREGRVTFINEAGRRILGVSALGVPIEAHSETYHTFKVDKTPYPPGELPLSRAVLQGETVMGVDVRIRRSDGSEVIVQANATPIRAEDGTQLGAVASFRDVTMERELERQKDDFLSAAAHDLKTPLTTIKGLAQMLARRLARLEPPAGTPLLESLTKIDATATRMTTLINELLDKTRIQMGRPLDLLPTPTDLVALAKEAVAEQEHTTSRHRLVVRAEVSHLIGQWDASRLYRVLTNLLSNAIKYSPGGGTIELTVHRQEDREGEWAVLSVRDEGLGIPERDLPHIFERFHRAGNVSHLIPGTGIGLAGACQIVEQHRGTISVESQEGQGSTFTVRLPLVPKSTAMKQSENPSYRR
jgi:signal transduction histidine kinase